MAKNGIDFRDELVQAIAYRMVEMWPSPGHDRPDAEKARRMVREALRRGSSSKHWGPVSQAALDLFQPLLGMAIPVLSQVTSAIVAMVQAQNQRGTAAEESIRVMMQTAMQDDAVLGMYGDVSGKGVPLIDDEELGE